MARQTEAAATSGKPKELAELDALNRAETSRTKSFISRRADRSRPPYGRRAIDVPRQCVFAGTVNPGGNGYLKDETGNRRFWPVACGNIDLEKLAADRDQLWAEATAAYREGGKWWLDGAELEKTAREEQARRFQEDAWASSIDALLDGADRVTVAGILGELGKKTADFTQADQNRVARHLIARGWRRHQRRTGKTREWGYIRPEIPPGTR